MASDLLNGFQAGMQMGQPFIEAAMRKKSLEREEARHAGDRAYLAQSQNADRSLKARMAADGIEAADEISQRREKGLDARAKASLLAAVNASRATEMGNAARAKTEAAQKADTALAKKLSGDADRDSREGIEKARVDAAKPMTIRDNQVDAMTAQITEEWDIVQALENPDIDRIARPGYKQGLQARLKAIRTLDEMTAKAADMAINNGSMSELEKVTDSRFKALPVAESWSAVKLTEIYNDDGTKISGYTMVNQRTGESKPLSPSAGQRLLDTGDGVLDGASNGGGGGGGVPEVPAIDNAGGLSVTADSLAATAERYAGAAFVVPASSGSGQLGSAAEVAGAVPAAAVPAAAVPAGAQVNSLGRRFLNASLGSGKLIGTTAGSVAASRRDGQSTGSGVDTITPRVRELQMMIEQMRQDRGVAPGKVLKPTQMPRKMRDAVLELQSLTR